MLCVQSYMKELNAYLHTGQDSSPVVVSGPSGIGKSSLLANWTSALRKDIKGTHTNTAQHDTAQHNTSATQHNTMQCDVGVHNTCGDVWLQWIGWCLCFDHEV